MAGAVFGDVGELLFVAGAAFGDVGASLFVAGAVFGNVGVSLFVAGAVFGEIWADSRSAKCCNFQYKCVSEAQKVTSANGRVQDDEFMVGSCSDHVRIMLGSWSNRPRIGIDASTVLG